MRALVGHHPALGGRHVGTPLEQRRGQLRRDLRQLWQRLVSLQAQLRRGRADQHRDGVPQLGALPFQVDQLGLGVAQLGGRLGDVERGAMPARYWFWVSVSERW